MVAVKCETDFVANGKDFIAMVQEILDAAVAAKAKSLDEVKTLKLANGEDALQLFSSVLVSQARRWNSMATTSSKAKTSLFTTIWGKHTLATIVQLSKNNEDAAHKVAMQVAAMKPVALDEASVPQEVKEEEYKVAIQKTKEEQVEKAVVAAIKKAGINANLVDSDDHIESNINKGWAHT